MLPPQRTSSVKHVSVSVGRSSINSPQIILLITLHHRLSHHLFRHKLPPHLRCHCPLPSHDAIAPFPRTLFPPAEQDMLTCGPIRLALTSLSAALLPLALGIVPTPHTLPHTVQNVMKLGHNKRTELDLPEEEKPSIV